MFAALSTFVYVVIQPNTQQYYIPFGLFIVNDYSITFIPFSRRFPMRFSLCYFSCAHFSLFVCACDHKRKWRKIKSIIRSNSGKVFFSRCFGRITWVFFSLIQIKEDSFANQKWFVFFIILFLVLLLFGEKKREKIRCVPLYSSVHFIYLRKVYNLIR